MEKKRLKKGLSYTELCGLLDKTHKEDMVVSLWQKMDSEVRNIFRMKIVKIEAEKAVIVLKANGKELDDRLDLGKPIYFQSCIRSMTFKCDEYILKGEHLVLMIPNQNDILIKEMRQFERFNLEDSEERTINMEFEVGLSGSGKFKSHCYRIIDISETGMAIEVKSHHLNVIKRGCLAKIKSILDINFNMVESEIVHITKINEEKNIFKAGVVFKKSIDKDQLREILAQFIVYRPSLAAS